MEYKREDLPLSAGAYLDVKRIIHKIVVLGVSITEDCRKHFFLSVVHTLKLATIKTSEILWTEYAA